MVIDKIYYFSTECVIWYTKPLLCLSHLIALQLDPLIKHSLYAINTSSSTSASALPEILHKERVQRANTARGGAECYICPQEHPECSISHSAWA